MNYSYYFKWKRVGMIFWRRSKVIGHRFEEPQNKMVLYLENGAVREVAKWSDCEVLLGADWVNATRKSMEVQAGQPVSLNLR